MAINNVKTITLPLTTGTFSLAGVSGSTNTITLDTQMTGAAAGTGAAIYNDFLVNGNGTLSINITDFAANKDVSYVLPSLTSATAITQLVRINNNTAEFNGTYSLLAAGDYSSSATQYMMVFGGTGSEVIKGSTASNAVSVLSGGSGNDAITGSAYYSAMNGGSGTNTLHGLSGNNYFKMSTLDNGTNVITADAGSASLLQVYALNTTTATVNIGDSNHWNFLQKGNDLTGFVTDTAGNTSTFTVTGQYAATKAAVQAFNFYLQGTTGAYLSAGFGSASSNGNEIFAGTNGDDLLNLNNYSDLTGRAFVFGNSGNDVVRAKDGVVLRVYNNQDATVDKVIYGHASTAYTVADKVNTDGSIAANVSYTGVTTSDYLSNVQRLQFTDTNVALDISPTQTAGSVYMLYQATFNRTPDAAGLGYWIAQVDKGANIITTVAASFVQSPEFVAKYGANPSNASYIDNLYQNVLHRAGESGGVAYWNGQLNTGAASKAFVLEQFATLAEGAALVAPAIAHGIAYQQFLG